MKLLFLLLSLLASSVCWAAGASPCPVTVGTLTLNVYQPRTSCISPCLLFFDTTGSPSFFQSNAHTTDTATLGGQNNVVQDVYYTWSFGDPNASGTGTWANGSRPNVNSKNQATGPVASHLYVLPTNGTTDLATNVEVWAYDGNNIATCTVSVTVFAPSGANGFSGISTICAFNSTQGTGCPTGAATVTASTLAAATASLASGKRVLLKCGDTFSGSLSIASTINKASIGAYGGCENSSSGLPNLSGAGSPTISLTGTNAGGTTDVRIADLSFADGAYASIAVNAGYQNTFTYTTQITVYNIICNNVHSCVWTSSWQTGIIQTTSIGSDDDYYLQVGNNQCLNAATGTVFCGQPSYNQANYANTSYNAFMGNSTTISVAHAVAGTENTRVGGCRMCVFSNNTFSGVFGANSLLKFHDGNNFVSSATWIGQYSEIVEISDNLFINGPNGGYDISFAPQNQSYDERLRYGILERNLHYLNNGEVVGPLISANFTTLRNNALYNNSTTNTFQAYCYYATHQGAEPATQPGQLEIYNNTCYGTNSTSRFQNACIQTDANGGNFIENNLCFNAGAGITVAGVATGNTISNNSANSTTNFSPQNHSTTFQVITDFKPASVVTGASSTVPNYFDATQLSWIGAYTLGALSGAAPAP